MPTTSILDTKSVSQTRKFKDVKSCRSVYTNVKKQDEKRAKNRATVRSQLEGGRPYDVKVLERRNELWRCNVNFRDAEAARDKAMLPYWDMANNGRSYIGVNVHDRANDAERWAQIFEECFDLFIKDWSQGWVYEYLKIMRDFMDFGIGHPYWKDMETVRFDHIPFGKVLFQDQTDINNEKWEILCIEKTMPVHELMAYISTPEKEQRAKFVGWHPKAMKALIKYVANTSTRELNIYRWEELQDEIVNNDIFLSQDFPPIEVAIVAVRQKRVEDGIGVWIIPRKPIISIDETGNKLPEFPEDDFLFRKVKGYAPSFSQILGSLMYESGPSGQIHGIKGFALRNFAGSNILNRAKCKVFDANSMAQSINVKRSGDKSEDGPVIEAHGGINVISANMEEFRFLPKTSEGIGVAEYFEKGIDQNNQLYRDTAQIAGVPTKGQADLIAAENSSVSSTQSALYQTQLGGNLFTEMVRRLRKTNTKDDDAIKFKKRCIERGIPKKWFHKLEITVSAGSATGGGNPEIRTQKWIQTLNLLGNSTRLNKDWLYENYIADVHGARAVEKALLPKGRVSEEYEIRHAAMENQIMQGGTQMQVVQIDNHMAQIPEHMKTLNMIVESFKQTRQAPPDELAPFVELVIPHVDTHFAHAENDDTVAEQRNQLFGQWANLRQATTGMLNALKAQEQAQAKRDQDQAAAGNTQGAQPTNQPTAPAGATTQ